ncbi:MAG: hypothetical protein IJR85_00600 [Synergistaceae bacterium]|nr:hypothetical protein [Synergistaceae bacterium]
MAFFLGVLIALEVLVCGTAFADLAFVSENGTLSIVKASGTPQSTSISAADIFPFTHNGNPRILVTSSSGTISVYNPSDLTAPLASGTLSNASQVEFIAELGSNIVLTFENGSQLVEIDPATCATVNTWSQSGCYPSYVYPYGGQVVVTFDLSTGTQGGYSDPESGTGYAYAEGDVITTTMDSLGHITGQVDNIGAFGLEASGGELYFPLGGGDDYEELSRLQGIYRVSGMLGNMNTNNAVRVTTDNPNVLCRDGNGGLYYTVFDSGYPRFIRHWDGSNSSQVYDAGSNAIDKMYYDISSKTLYAEIIEGYTSGSYNVNLSALVQDSNGQFSVARSFGNHSNFAVIGNSADSSGGTPDTPQQEAPQTQNTLSSRIAYITADTMNLVLLNGTSQESSHHLSATASVRSFKHRGQDRLLVSEADPAAGTSTISVYNPDDLAAPLASMDIRNSGLMLVNYVTEYGENIVIAGNGFQSEQGAILEINPDTCEIVDTYNFGGMSSNNYSAGDVSNYSEGMFTLNGKIYATFSRVAVGSSTIGWQNYTCEMDGLGNITNTAYDLPASYILKPADGILYLSTNDGIYRIGTDLVFANAAKIAEGNIHDFCSDGNGGLYYEYDSRYIYHWDGQASRMIYDAGDSVMLGWIQYDAATRTLAAVPVAVNSAGEEIRADLLVFSQNSGGELTLASKIENVRGGFGFISTKTSSAVPVTQTDNLTLPSAVIEPTGPLSDNVLANIASSTGIDASLIKYITSANLSSPRNPTQSIADTIKEEGYELTHKLNTITVDETGYYVFVVNIPKELQGMKANDVRLYAADRNIFASVAASVLPTGIISVIELDSFGLKLDTLPEKIIAVGFLNAGTPFSVYLSKIIIALLAGGCTLAGTGILLLFSGLPLIRKKTSLDVKTLCR